MFFQIIESSSSGNSAFLECDGVRILIDAGARVRKIKSFLRERKLSIEDIDAIFITHEHTDHFQSLHSFADVNAKVFANRTTAEYIQYKEPSTKKMQWHLFETGQSFNFYGVDITSFSIPHDTSDPVGFTFTHNGKKLVYATDLGKVTHSVRDIASSANVLVLESNYCPLMLERSSRPYSLKTRITGSCGHLSNADAIALIETLPQSIERIFLSHISRQCNDVNHIVELLTKSNISEGLLSNIEVVSPHSESSSAYEF